MGAVVTRDEVSFVIISERCGGASFGDLIELVAVASVACGSISGSPGAGLQTSGYGACRGDRLTRPVVGIVITILCGLRAIASGDDFGIEPVDMVIGQRQYAIRRRRARMLFINPPDVPYMIIFFGIKSTIAFTNDFINQD